MRRVLGVLCVVALAGAGVLVVGVAQPASAGVLPTCPASVTTSMTLTTDCQGGISVDADGVRLNLGGHTVTCLGASVPGIEVNASSVKVLNGAVKDCEYTQLTGTDNRVARVVFVGNHLYGLWLTGEGHRVVQNLLVGNVEVGLAVDGNGHTIKNNTALFDSAGISASDVSNTNVYVGNTAVGNTIAGIAIANGSSSNKVAFNRAFWNGETDLLDANPGCDSNAWLANFFLTRSQPCIH